MFERILTIAKLIDQHILNYAYYDILYVIETIRLVGNSRVYVDQ